MNFWCFNESYFSYTHKMFGNFLHENGQKDKSEFYIPVVADQFIREGNDVVVIPTSSNWFGVTYKEDAPVVKQKLDELIKAGEYPSSLWE